MLESDEFCAVRPMGGVGVYATALPANGSRSAEMARGGTRRPVIAHAKSCAEIRSHGTCHWWRRPLLRMRRGNLLAEFYVRRRAHRGDGGRTGIPGSIQMLSYSPAALYVVCIRGVHRFVGIISNPDLIVDGAGTRRESVRMKGTWVSWPLWEQAVSMTITGN